MDSFRTRVHFSSEALQLQPADVVCIDSSVIAAKDIHGVDVSPWMNDQSIPLLANEETKRWDTVAIILQNLLDNGTARDGSIIAIGGGVLCDLAAFAASVYMRGIDCVLVPTTLLAMVDAAFGGKTGMNFGGYKNMVGTFHPARELIIDTRFLRSLPHAELHSGMGEVFKAALLDADSGLWDILQKQGVDLLHSDRTSDTVWLSHAAVWRDIVERSLAVKGKIVTEDFRESGSRAYLNLGHTYAHAAESVLGFGRVPHGTLVVWGIIRALKLGVILGMTEQTYLKEVAQLAEKMGFPGIIDLPADKTPADLVEAMRSDKKKRGGRVRFVLQRGQGETELRVVEEAVVLQSLQGGVRYSN